MRLGQAKERVVSLPIIKRGMVQKASKKSDEKILESAQYAIFHLSHPHEFDNRSSERLWAVQSAIKWLAETHGFDDVELDSPIDLKIGIERMAIIREFLIRCVPKLNDAFELGFELPIKGANGE